MALIVEDGTGIADANSYGTVAEADAFFADRNILNWAGASATTQQKEGYLIEAADFMNAFFTAKGEPLLLGQPMSFPTLAYDGIPIQVKQAQFWLAKERADNGPLFTALGDRQVVRERKQLVGVGEKEVQYAESNVDQFGRVGSTVWGLLRPFTVVPGWMQQANVIRG